MNYKEAMKFINDSAKFSSSANAGLNRTKRILEILGNPHKNIKCIHIAGTNGKGSVTAMISSILIEEGYKVGMFTSPYIQEFEERVQINNKNIPKEDLSIYITKVYNGVEKVINEGYGNPTQFEIITCTSLLYFYDKNVDYAVMEVGLGGRFDPTNVIDPILSIITSISYDHMNILGNTLEEIGYEKAGIIKEKVPVIVYPQDMCVEKVIKNVARDKKCEIINVPKDCVKFLKCINVNLDGEDRKIQNVFVKTQDKEYNINLSLLGKHQLLNCGTVIYSIEALRKLGILIKDKSIIDGLLKVKWMGRFEILGFHPLIVIDGAHNIDGINKLRDSVKTYLEYRDIVLILGILKDKDVDKMIRVIGPLAKKIICVTPNSYRGESGEELAFEVKKYNKNCISIDDYEKAYIEGLNSLNKDDLLLISGSLYMIGDMRKIITKDKNIL